MKFFSLSLVLVAVLGISTYVHPTHVHAEDSLSSTDSGKDTFCNINAVFAEDGTYMGLEVTCSDGSAYVVPVDQSEVDSLGDIDFLRDLRNLTTGQVIDGIRLP